MEYYLSDDNLKVDKFFNRELTRHSDGFMEIKLIMKCKKVQDLKVNLETVVLALKDSLKVELSPANDLIRRKDNTSVPTLNLDNRVKRVKMENNSDQQAVIYSIKATT